MWLKLTLDDGTARIVNFNNIVSYKKQHDDDKTILFGVDGRTFWVRETVAEIMRVQGGWEGCLK